MRRERGVTLISVIVTVIIMLILVSITVSSVVGKNGVNTKMEDTGKSINKAIRNANKKMNTIDEPDYYKPRGGN
jgi:type II secretory pathway pseudopilin PulG